VRRGTTSTIPPMKKMRESTGLVAGWLRKDQSVMSMHILKRVSISSNDSLLPFNVGEQVDCGLRECEVTGLGSTSIHL
jgi:hypothetical protein